MTLVLREDLIRLADVDFLTGVMARKVRPTASVLPARVVSNECDVLNTSGVRLEPCDPAPVAAETEPESAQDERVLAHAEQLAVDSLPDLEP